MKKVKLIAVSLLISVLSFGQSVNGVNVKDFNSDYIEIVGYEKLMSHKVMINVDYGQERKYFKSQVFRDENEKPVIFNGMIDAMNFFRKYGYEFKQAYVIGSSGMYVYHWLLEKSK